MKRFIIVLSLALLAIPAWAQDTSTSGANSARRSPQPRIRYELGADSKVQEGVPKGRLEGPFLFNSKIIENTVRKYWIYVPAQYKPEQPANVLVFQDAARATNPQGVLRVQNVLENLIAKQQIPVTVGIFITPGQRGTEFPENIGMDNPNNRLQEYDVLDDKYTRFIIDEMLPEVGQKYKLTNDPAGRAIGGSSSGAICAFTVAWHRPDQFRNVISMIGSFTNLAGGHVYPQLVMEAEKKPIRIILQDGVNDNRSPNNLDRDWHLQNKKMIAAFEAKGYDMAYAIGEGAHSDDHGGAMLPQMLRWIWRDAPGVIKPDVDLIAEARGIKPVKIELFPGFDKSKSTDPSGTWTWTQTGGQNASTNTLQLALKNGQLTGSLKTVRGQGGEPTIAEIKRPVQEGNKLTFDVTSQFQNAAIDVTYQGIVQGDKIAGWSMRDQRGTQQDTAWQATRVADQVDYIGTWAFQINGPDGNAFESTFKLDRDGDKHKGVYTSQFFGEAAAKNITIKDGTLTFDVDFDQDGNPLKFSYTVKNEGGKLVGQIKSDFGGQANETPFTVKKK